MTLALDSWAVLCYLRDEDPGAGRVEEAFTQRPVISWINLGEVYYITLRQEGEEVARRVLGSVLAAVVADEVSPDRVMAASRIKARYPMAYADAFAIATATAHQALLLTGDPEILEVGGPWKAEDLRR